MGFLVFNSDDPRSPIDRLKVIYPNPNPGKSRSHLRCFPLHRHKPVLRTTEAVAQLGPEEYFALLFAGHRVYSGE